MKTWMAYDFGDGRIAPTEAANCSGNRHCCPVFRTWATDRFTRLVTRNLSWLINFFFGLNSSVCRSTDEREKRKKRKKWRTSWDHVVDLWREVEKSRTTNCFSSIESKQNDDSLENKQLNTVSSSSFGNKTEGFAWRKLSRLLFGTTCDSKDTRDNCKQTTVRTA